MFPFDLTSNLTYLGDLPVWKSSQPIQPQMGWMCPRCQHVWSPFVRECTCQPPTVASSTIHITCGGTDGKVSTGTATLKSGPFTFTED